MLNKYVLNLKIKNKHWTGSASGPVFSKKALEKRSPECITTVKITCNYIFYTFSQCPSHIYPTTQLDLLEKNPVIGSKNWAVVLCYPAALHCNVFERLQAERRRQWLQK